MGNRGKLADGTPCELEKEDGQIARQSIQGVTSNIGPLWRVEKVLGNCARGGLEQRIIHVANEDAY